MLRLPTFSPQHPPNDFHLIFLGIGIGIGIDTDSDPDHDLALGFFLRGR